MKTVRAIDDLVIKEMQPPVKLAKGALCKVELVSGTSVVLITEQNEYLELDVNTFESGFEAVGEE